MIRRIFVLLLMITLLSGNLPIYASHEKAEEYWDIGLELAEQGNYLTAAKMFVKSAEEEQKSGEPRLQILTIELYEAGYYYNKAGFYKKSLEYYQEALEIDKKLGSNQYFLFYCNNIGIAYFNVGQYAKALDFFTKGLKKAQGQEKEGDIAVIYNNIGMVYDAWGKYERALKYYLKSLEIDKKSGADNFAIDYSNIGGVYFARGQYQEALEYFEKALETNKRLKFERGIAINYNNIGIVYETWGKLEKALKHYQKSLEIGRRLGLETSIAVSYNNIGGLYYIWGQNEKAQEFFKKALEIDKKTGRGEDIAIDYNNIGTVYASQKRYNKAEENLLKSIEIIEKIRKKAPTDELKRTYLQKQITAYQELISVYIKTTNVDKAFNIMELSKAKVLAESLAGKTIDLEIPYLEEVQQEMESNQGLLIYANSNRDEIVEMAVTSDSKRGIEVNKQEFIEKIQTRYGDEISKMVKRKERIREIKNFGPEETNELLGKEKEDEDFKNIIYYYRKRLTEGKNTEYIAKQLYKLLISPLEDKIKDKQELVIVPDGILNFIPFETLIDEEGNYLVEKYKISYIQSETVSAIIKDRNYPRDRKELLAFGGAIYEEKDYEEDIIENEKQLAYLQKQVDEALKDRGSIEKFYGKLGYGNWSNLPGTLAEVKSIGEILEDVIITTGEEVNEDRIKELSQQGDLANYKVLHFATHGIVVPEVPELSAVVLSQLEDDGSNQIDEDGYLRMGEIVDLEIRADFVNLSACDTGLGKIYAGEGVVGLTQSFLLAGANSLSVSLWSVADESTAKFMVAVYKLVKEEGLSYREAMNEVKLMFINGEFGDKYRKPYYWAPFVYYGS